ncbi:hypothetical protein [Pseudomonas tumuqii]|uniref:hypothetical protein n=1 Tax=Pseudomonas tumuqii TaxID=2715755 RepID=UPI00155811C5|nr:hypothetical protein [Pseudomonas tumuqii]
MFESILFRRNSTHPGQTAVDVGAIIEALLFYGSTHVMVDRSSLLELLVKFGDEVLFELISGGYLKVTYVESWNGIMTDSPGSGPPLHSPVFFTSSNHQFPDVLRTSCIEVHGKSGRGRRAASRLEKVFHVHQHDQVIADGVRDVFLNDQYMSVAARSVLGNLVPGVDFSAASFFARKVGDRFVVESDLDWLAVNRQYHQFVSPKHSAINPAYILSNIFNVECDLYFASVSSSELHTSLLNSRLISARINFVVQHRMRSQLELNRFQSALFPGAKSVREAVNSGKVSVLELLPVIESSCKFKKWLHGRPFDADLLAEYHKEVTKETIVDRLPGKTTRFAIFTGLGVVLDSFATAGVATTAGLAIGAFDGLFLDKLLKGWKPNQFIESKLGPALKKA